MGFSLIYTPVLHYDDVNGRPLVGGKLYTYMAGTSTPATTYRNKNGTELNENPIPLNERGECVCFLEEGMDYKFVLKDKLGTVIWEQDDVSIPEGNGGGVAQVQTNWNETNTSSPAFLRNKPIITNVTTTIEGPGGDNTEDVRSVDINLNTGRLTCNQSYYAGFVAPNVAEPPEETKLLAIGAGESNPSWKGMEDVQKHADWNCGDPTDPAFIENKPFIAGLLLTDSSGSHPVGENGRGWVEANSQDASSEPGYVQVKYTYNHQVRNRPLGYLLPSLDALPMKDADIKVLETVPVRFDAGGQVNLYVSDGEAYDVVLADSSVVVNLATTSSNTLHTVLKVSTESTSDCVGFTLQWLDEALVQHRLIIPLNETDKSFYFDVYIREVAHNSNIYSVARVSDFPCGFRTSPPVYTTRDNNTNWIGRNI